MTDIETLNPDKVESRKRYFVYSTLSTSMTYANYRNSATAENDMPQIESRVEIKGGAGVSKAGIDRVYTPRGVVTEVTADELRQLHQNELFKRHLANRYITVDEMEVHPEVAVAKGMNQRDNSSQIVPEDFIDADENTPKPMSGPPKKRTGFIDRIMGTV